MGTTDGFAQRPYVRESRRALTLRTVTELDVGVEASPGGSTVFEDTVGIGAYRIDLHPTPAGRSYVDVDCYPFQIPLRALVCRTVTNLVPAAKGIGTTHISNGALRLHPVEWSAGEAAATLAAHLVRHRITSQDAATSRSHVADIQRLLRGTLGSTLEWPEDIRTTPCPADVAVPRLVEPL
ncbi:hypothetical protein GCM10025864_14410 [Luteimicrobium album]|uniref:FAD-dependent oxidoreductase n=1 Tax=Luteimicrobium album TaxID=1054550 RepID=A0ABQ6HZ58_9MICO|nr:FAD-dependent oxidoreductase [Luteimicrobium album]GMA23682.1 hypothetical protein GCM10025864_14410 [Luteimicrobium album]